MKSLTLALLLLSPVAHAATLKVDCKGQYKNDKGVGQNVVLKSSAALDALEYTKIPNGRPVNQFDTVSLPVKKVVPMWPVATIVAERDDRPVDGIFTQLNLKIFNESVDPIYSANLLIVSKWYDRIGGREASSEQNVTLVCKMVTIAQ